MTSLGLYIGRPESNTEDAARLVYGRDVAVRGTVGALLRYGDFDRVRLLESIDPDDAPRAPADWLAAALASAPRTQFERRGLHELRSVMRALDDDAWHDPDCDLISLAAMRARFGRRWFPVTATVHTASYAGTLESRCLLMLLQGLQPCDAFICTSTAVRAVCARQLEIVADRVASRVGGRPRARIALPVIPLGVDVDAFGPQDGRDARRRLGWPVGERVVLALGRVSPRDKADLAPLLIALAPVLREQDLSDVRLVIAGAGRAAEIVRLTTLAHALGIADRVAFDPVRPEHRHLAYAAADVFVSPVDCLQETFGLTPVEAMAAGVPQVVADWDGYRDTVVDGVTGFRVETAVLSGVDEAVDLAGDLFDEIGLRDQTVAARSTLVDVEAMAAAVALLLRDPALRGQMSDASRRRAREHYAWPVVVAQYRALWEELGAIAAGLDGAPSLADDFTLPATAAFRDYPSTVLGLQTRIETGRTPPALYPGPGGLVGEHDPLDDVLLAEVLQVIDARTRTHEPLTIGDVETLLTTVTHPPAWVRRHVMFLLKYGLLRRATK